MKRLWMALFLVAGFLNNCLGQQDLSIIPNPVSAVVQQGHFTLNPNTRIQVEDSSAEKVARLFVKKIRESTGYALKISDKKSGDSNAIQLDLNPVYDSTLGREGYLLKITSRRAFISANKAHGLFYGIQTLKQLLPPQIESDTIVENVVWQMPCVDIMDYPEFAWRGLMLDVSRHFFSKKEIEQYLDEMAKYKFNVFHWHLTDDQGWRIQIKGWPALTDIGAWRVPRLGNWNQVEPPQTGEKASYGGFYTREDIREIIAYAQQRYIDILPEIDVPAHSLALIASYPNLSCTKEQYPVPPGAAPMSMDDVLCVAEDSTWMVLDAVFSQVARLFPFPYIHVGGDEADREFWMKDPRDLALMKKEGLKTPAELQSYFEKKVEKLILSKNKKMIGWDEILEGGLAPEAAVMSWRGMKGGIKAARMGHHVIMSPYGSMYISQLQGDPLAEPKGPGMIRLKKCYATNILPDGVNPQMVLGGEACLWTEYVPDFRHAEYMTWPRALAASEVFWGTKSSWADFSDRVVTHLPRFDAAQVKYATSMYDPIISARKENGDLRVVLGSEIPGLDLYYAFDGTDPDSFYPKYKGVPLSIPKGASEIRVISFKDGNPVGKQINCPVEILEKRVKNN